MISAVFQIAFQWRVLGDAVGKLQVTRCLHRLLHRADVAVEVSGDGCAKVVFPELGGGNEDASMMV